MHCVDVICLGFYDEALVEHTEELHWSELGKIAIDKGKAHRCIGECHIKRSDYKKALFHLEQYRTIAEDCRNRTEQQRANTALFEAYIKWSSIARPRRQRELLREAEECLKLSRCLIPDRKNPQLEMEMKFGHSVNNARLYEEQGKVDDTIKEYETIKSEIASSPQSTTPANQLLLHRACYNLAKIFMNKKRYRYTEAWTNAQGALEYAQNAKSSLDIRQAYQLKAQVLLLSDKVREAVEILELGKAVGVCGDKDELEFLLDHAKECMKVSDDYIVNERWDFAVKKYDELGDAAARNGYHQLALHHYLNQEKYYEEMVDNRTLASILALETEDNGTLASIFASIAETYRDLHRDQEAYDYYAEELKVRGNLELKQIAETHLIMAELQERMKKMSNSAIKCLFDEAFSYAVKGKETMTQARILKSKSLFLRDIRDSKEWKTTRAKLQELCRLHAISDRELNCETAGDDDADATDDDMMDVDESSADNRATGDSLANGSIPRPTPDRRASSSQDLIAVKRVMSIAVKDDLLFAVHKANQIATYVKDLTCRETQSNPSILLDSHVFIDMASDIDGEQLFVMDTHGVYRLTPNPDLITKFTTETIVTFYSEDDDDDDDEDEPKGLSVTIDGNLLVTFGGPRSRLVIYSAKEGAAIREVSLGSEIPCPTHAVQLGSGNRFVVSFAAPYDPDTNHLSNDPGGVCLIDDDGNALKFLREAERKSLNDPCHLALDDGYRFDIHKVR